MTQAPVTSPEVASLAATTSAERPIRRLRECPDCGLFQRVPHLEPGHKALCLRCDAVLRRRKANPLNRAMACAVAALTLFILGLDLPLLALRAVGQYHEATVFTGPNRLNQVGMWELGLVVVITLVAMPAAKLLLLLSVLVGVRLRQVPAFLPVLFGWFERIGPWAMIEVFLLGLFVAYTRLQAIATVETGPALYAFGGVMLATVAADAALDSEAVWEAMERRGLRDRRAPTPGGRPIGCDCCGLVSTSIPGEPCPRCRRSLHVRKPDSASRTWALLLAGILLYLPANMFPVMTVTRFGRGAPNTILSGVGELARAGMWPLAILVFVASLAVPIFKLLSLSYLLVTTHRRSADRLRQRTQLFRIIDVIGRWSMIDIFMLTVLVGIVRMGFIANVQPGDGAIAFAGVVILTMVAVSCFDPRLIWDAAGEPAPVPATADEPEAEGASG